MLKLALLVSVLAILLSGCGGPYAADLELDRPSETVTVTPMEDLEGTLTVTSLPEPPVTAGIVNCFFVGSDAEDLAAVRSAWIELAWDAETPLTGDLTVEAWLGDPFTVSATGASPLKLAWEPGDGGDGPQYMPFLVRVSGPATIAQEASFTVHVDGDGTQLEAVAAPCEF